MNRIACIIISCLVVAQAQVVRASEETKKFEQQITPKNTVSHGTGSQNSPESYTIVSIDSNCDKFYRDQGYIDLEERYNMQTTGAGFIVKSSVQNTKVFNVQTSNKSHETHFQSFFGSNRSILIGKHPNDGSFVMAAQTSWKGSVDGCWVWAKIQPSKVN